MFKWNEATEEQMARHIAKVSPQQVTAIIRYYEDKGNEEMLTKILAARIVAKRYRAANKVAKLVEDYNLQGVNYATEPSQRSDGMGVETQGQ